MQLSKNQRAEMLICRFIFDVKKFGNRVANSVAYNKILLNEEDEISSLLIRFNLLNSLVDCPKIYGINVNQVKPLLGEAKTYLELGINAYRNLKY